MAAPVSYDSSRFRPLSAHGHGYSENQGTRNHGCEESTVIEANFADCAFFPVTELSAGVVKHAADPGDGGVCGQRLSSVDGIGQTCCQDAYRQGQKAVLNKVWDRHRAVYKWGPAVGVRIF